jgi:AcrR family transcriptional regulator
MKPKKKKKATLPTAKIVEAVSEPTERQAFTHRRLFDIYALFREGLTAPQVCKAVGISERTLYRWTRSRSIVAAARKYAEEDAHSQSMTLGDHILMRLPDDLKDLWAELEAASDSSSAEDFDLSKKDCGEMMRMQLFAYTLATKAMFNVSEACRLTGIAYSQYTSWKRAKPDFFLILQTIQEMKLDWCESHLMRLIARGDSPATIHAMKTLGRKRGFGDHKEVEIKGDLGLSLTTVDILELDLPDEVLQQIAEAMAKLPAPETE